jgi:protoporphyrin/coproporphyrin ferrochelatase
MARAGILLTAYGGPDSLEAVGPFMLNLTGREPSPELIARVQAKYARIGGASPLPQRTAEIASALQVRLDELGRDAEVRVGMRYWGATIAESLDALVADGASRIVQVSLSPFESAITSGAYRNAVTNAASAHEGVEVVETASFYDADGFVAALAQAAVAARASLTAERPLVVFTAHSLPVADAEADPRYVEQLRWTVAAVASGAGLAPAAGEVEVLPGIVAFGHAGETPWLFSYQSRGMTDAAWLEPQIEDVLDAAATAGYDGVAVCPVGFGTDHMETLYDLDIVAAERAAGLGLAFVRASVPNASPEMIDALVSRIEPLL